MKMFAKRAFGYFGVFGMAIVFILFLLKIYILKDKPELYEIDFSYFSGKIINENKTTIPQKLSQEFPFTEASTWGPEATLAFGDQDGIFCFRIWREDPSGNGEFQYAKKYYERYEPWKNVLWKIGEVKQQGNKFIFLPTRDKGCIFPLLVITGIIAVFFRLSYKSLKQS